MLVAAQRGPAETTSIHEASQGQRRLHGRKPAATASSSLRNHNPALVRRKYGESGEWQRIEPLVALTVYSGAGADPSGRGNADPG